jgi:hypothetical protein
MTHIAYIKLITLHGAIGIMDYLSTMVPLYPDGRPHTIVTHCDGGAFERMVGARRVRAPDRGPVRKLLGLEPSAQEFHKRGIMLQVRLCCMSYVLHSISFKC